MGWSPGRIGYPYFNLFRFEIRLTFLLYPAFTFPYSKSTVSSEEEWQLERTLAIIKPDVVYYEEVILRKIKRAGFTILQVCESKIFPTKWQIKKEFKVENLYSYDNLRKHEFLRSVIEISFR